MDELEGRFLEMRADLEALLVELLERAKALDELVERDRHGSSTDGGDS